MEMQQPVSHASNHAAVEHGPARQRFDGRRGLITVTAAGKKGEDRVGRYIVVEVIFHQHIIR